MTPLHGHSLSHVDAAWLRMDRLENPMVITSALTLRGSVPFQTMLEIIESRFLTNERFKSCVVDAHLPLVAPRWERDPHFDVRSHVHHVRLPAPGGEAAFDELVGDLMSSRLDPAKPLWQTYIVDDAPGGTAMVSRIHHCLADGVALVRVLLGLADGPTAPPQEIGLARGGAALNLPALAQRAASYATTLGRLLLLPSDPKTALRGALAGRKQVTRGRAFELSALKATARQKSATVNDILTAILAGALHFYLEGRGASVSGLTLRALVPVFLRDKDNTGLGNHFGLVFADLPVSLRDPELRLAAAKRSLDQLKAQDDATVAFAVLDAVGIASQEIEHVWLDVFSRKASVLFSNVPGPSEPLQLAGYHMDDVTVWAPVGGYLGVGFTGVSYAGKVRISIHVDSGLGIDPSALAQALDVSAAQYLQ
jgi:diacylglycerol O-acyltransferase